MWKEEAGVVRMSTGFFGEILECFLHQFFNSQFSILPRSFPAFYPILHKPFVLFLLSSYSLYLAQFAPGHHWILRWHRLLRWFSFICKILGAEIVLLYPVEQNHLHTQFWTAFCDWGTGFLCSTSIFLEVPTRSDN